MSSALCHSISPAGLVSGNCRIHLSTSSLAASLVQCNRSLRLTIAPSTTSGLVVRKRTAPQTTRSLRYIIGSSHWHTCFTPLWDRVPRTSEHSQKIGSAAARQPGLDLKEYLPTLTDAFRP